MIQFEEILELDLNKPQWFDFFDLTHVKSCASSFRFWASMCLAGLSATYFYRVWKAQQYFRVKGIKTPKFTFLVGHVWQLKKKGYTDCLRQWTQELGKTYGIYEGHTPILVTSDLEIIQEVYIKKYGFFSGRKFAPFQESDEDPYTHLAMATGDRWKRMRTLMNPTFTTSKIKTLVPLMQKCSSRLVSEIEHNLESDLNITDLLDRLTMDTIFNCAFGIDLDAQKDPQNPFLVNGLKFFRDRADLTTDIFLRVIFPEFKPTMHLIGDTFAYFSNKFLGGRFLVPYQSLFSKINFVLEHRMNHRATSKQDYLQIILDAYDQSLNEQEVDKNDMLDVSSMKVVKKLTEQEIKANIIIFLLAGFETTASALSYCMFVLTKYPDELRKLQEEIDCVIDQNVLIPDYDTVQKLTYMDSFVKEVLRVYPIGNSVINRRCIHPTTVKDIDIETDVCVAVDALSLHNDPEYWHQPERFDPTRFASENKINPLVYVPFGIGSRLCIGMRFAMIEIKLTLAQILRKFDVLASPKTPDEIIFAEGVVRRPRDGVNIMMKKRAPLTTF